MASKIEYKMCITKPPKDGEYFSMVEKGKNILAGVGVAIN